MRAFHLRHTQRLMSRFYFHLDECGAICADEEGFELADIDAARVQAIAAARDIMCDEVSRGRLCLSCRIDVADESGAIVLVVPFKEAVTLSGL